MDVTEPRRQNPSTRTADAALSPESPHATRAYTFSHDDWGRFIMVDPGGREHVDVRPVRCFPYSARDEWIAVCSAAGRELACFPSLASLSDDARRLVETELAQRTFLPVIHRIVDVTRSADPTRWMVETDHGPTSFLVNGEDDLRRLDAERVLVTDTNGVRYLIPNRHALDAASRRFLARFLSNV